MAVSETSSEGEHQPRINHFVKNPDESILTWSVVGKIKAKLTNGIEIYFTWGYCCFKAEDADCIFVNIFGKKSCRIRKMIRAYQRDTKAKVITMGCYLNAMLDDTLEIVELESIIAMIKINF